MRAAGNISHGKKSVLFQLFGIASSYPPEIREGIGDSTAGADSSISSNSAIRTPCSSARNVLGYNIHGNLWPDKDWFRFQL